MYVVCVYVHVLPEHRQAFLEASCENARQTIEEPGNLRFDVLQQTEAPNRFVLYEVYRDEAGMNAHKQTPHYARWRDTVEPWMAEARRGVKHLALFPESAEAWLARRS